jgi:hypothetical protein
MKNMHKGINFFVISCISLYFFSCNGCHEYQSGKYNFTREELQINPYNGHEVVIFQNLSNDSLHFSAGERTSEIIRIYPNQEDECKNNYHVLEVNKIVLSSNSNSWQFSISLAPIPTMTINLYDKSIGFDVSIPGQSKKTQSSAALMFEHDTITGYYENYSNLGFHPSLTLGSKSFIDVYEIELFRSDMTVEKWVNKIYYTIKQGIVGFSTDQNELWYLNN